jgi:DNA-binding GntR family transcriptional regulator
VRLEPLPRADAQALRKIERTSVAQSAYRAIRDSVISGRFGPGAQLVESRLAAELGVSRGPVREALRRLSEEGLVIEYLHRGMFVREFTADGIADIYNVRIALESLAARLATRAHVPVDRLERLVDEMRRAAEAGDLQGVTAREVEFHETLCELSGNNLVASLFYSISAQVQMAVQLDNESYAEPVEVAREHEPVVEAIKSRDEELAVERIVSHIVCTVEPFFRRVFGSEQAEAALARLLGPRS